MPPAKIAGSKRKAEHSASLWSEEDENVAVTQVSPEEIARRAFLGVVTEKVTQSKHSSGGGGSATVEGVVLRVGKITVQGKSGMVPKLQATIAVTKIMASGCKDVVTTGVDGMYFGLPSRQLEPSPDDLARDKNAKGTTVLEFDDGSPRAVYLGVISASFYTDGPAKPGQTAPAASQGIEACVPGMKVLVTGVSCSFAKNGTALYTNARKIVPIGDAIPVGGTAAAIIAEARSANAQRGAALLWSMGMKGMFGLTYPDVSHQQQADACKALWQQVVEGASSKCESLALSLGNEPAVQAAVTALQNHATRLKSVSAEAVAAGEPLFHVDLQKDCITPYQAPLVQYGVSPNNPMTQNCEEFFNPETRAQVPSSFVDANVTDITFRGALIQVDFKLYYLFDKPAALLAIQEAKSPILYSTHAACSVKMSKKMVGQELFGVLCDTKIEMVACEALRYADMAVWASVFPRDPDSLQLDGHFANVSGIDLHSGVTKVGVQVSEKWLDANMLSGRGVFIFSQIESLEYVEASPSAGPAPTLHKNGIQALTECAWDIDSLKTPAGKSKQYFVIYSECSKDVANKASLATSVDDGESHIADVVAAREEKDPNCDIKCFLRESCVVYAVAV